MNVSLQMTFRCIVAFAGLCAPCVVHAQQSDDKSGTNPSVLHRTASVSNEYRALPDDYFYDVANFRYVEPMLDGRVALRLTVPLEATDLPSFDDAGIGDVAVRGIWIAHKSPEQALVLSTEIYAPTANEDYFGTGKWVAAPGLTWVLFPHPEIIIAPSFVHNLSFAGDESRADVNRSDFDLYTVYKPHGQKWWITSDLTISHDFEADATPLSWEVAFGRNLATLENGAALNGYIRPGVGVGNDRPYDFNIEVGLSLVGF